MAKEDAVRFEGKVLSSLPGMQFKVQLDGDHVILAHLSGKIRKNFIRIVPGDAVIVEMSPYDLTKGRIVFRGRETSLPGKPDGGPMPPRPS